VAPLIAGNVKELALTDSRRSAIGYRLSGEKLKFIDLLVAERSEQKRQLRVNITPVAVPSSRISSNSGVKESNSAEVVSITNY
jgi:hypothetical protein